MRHALIQTAFVLLVAGCGQVSFTSGTQQTNVIKPTVPIAGQSEAIESNAAQGDAASPDSRDELFNFTMHLDQNSHVAEEVALTEKAAVTADFSIATSISNAQINHTVLGPRIARHRGAVNYLGTPVSFMLRLAEETKIDIIFAIDNSSSMGPEQEKLAATFNELSAGLGTMDWRMLFTSSDPSGPCSHAVIEKGQPNAAAAFAAAIRLGSSGSDKEVPMWRAQQIFQGRCPTANLRPEARIAILILSNEDECSNSNDCPVVNGQTLKGDFINGTVNSGYPHNWMGMGIIAWHPNQSAAQCPIGLNQAHRITNHASIGGLVRTESICNSSYAAFMRSFGEGLNALPPSNFRQTPPSSRPFRIAPVQASLISGNGVVPPEHFTLTSHSVTFARDPQWVGRAVQVNLEYSDDAPVHTYTFANPCDHATRNYTGQVMRCDGTGLNCADLPASHYSFDGPRCTVTFNDPPAPNFTLLFQHEAPVVPYTETALGPNALVTEPVVITVNGAPWTSFTVDAAQKKVRYTNPVPPGALVVRFKTLNDPTLRYNLSLPLSATSLSIIDRNTRAPLAYTRDGQNVVLDRKEVIPGRTVQANYEYSRSSGPHSLLRDPVPESVDLADIRQKCGNASAVSFDPSAKTLTISNCALDQEKAVARYVTSNPIQSVAVPADSSSISCLASDACEWSVYLNDTRISNYLIEGLRIRFPNPLPDGKLQIKIVKKK